MMTYVSTRGNSPEVSAEEAILNGIAPDGGLYVPSRIPVLDGDELRVLREAGYAETAFRILRLYLPESAFPEDALRSCIGEAYRRFDGDAPVCLKELRPDRTVLELWHGPTCAFKDMALQLFPRLIPLCKKACGRTEETWVLTATSGDTGKAAMEGFRDVPGTRITVFFPRFGVSRMQELQMRTQEGDNVDVAAVEGNFDDAQSGVKRIFGDLSFRTEAENRGIRLSSANSINWGRLLPQIVYYVYASLKVSPDGSEPVDFVVPTGNFGNILAGYFAKRMGCPVGKLICASNANNVLTDFFATGTYDRNREFYRTSSPSMDILISSNLERLLYLETGDASSVSGWMNDLAVYGRYTVPPDLIGRIRGTFDFGWASDEEGENAIREAMRDYGYLMDPHTAVGYAVMKQRAFRETRTVLVSTAHPYKFASAVWGALTKTADIEDGFSAADMLAERTGLPVPPSLSRLRKTPVRFHRVCAPEEMTRYLTEDLRSRDRKEE